MEGKPLKLRVPKKDKDLLAKLETVEEKKEEKVEKEERTKRKNEEKTKDTRTDEKRSKPDIKVFNRPCDGQTMESIISDQYSPSSSSSTIGEGVYGAIKDVVHQGSGDHFVDKQYHSINDISFVEIDVLSRFCHPNLLHAESKYLELDPDVRRPLTERIKFHLIMKKADMNLTQYLERNGPISVPRAIKIMYQLLLGVRFLHSQHYYHCDIKPDNILFFADEDRFVVADFGISAPVEYFETNRTCATPWFASPQAHAYFNTVLNSISDLVERQAARDALSPILSKPYYQETLNQVQTDIFSLGCIFYQLLSNQMLHRNTLAYNHSITIEQIVRHYDKEYTNIRTYIDELRGVPGDVKYVLRGMLALKQFDPNDKAHSRYKSVGYIMEDRIFDHDYQVYKNNFGTIWTTGLMADTGRNQIFLSDKKTYVDLSPLLQEQYLDGFEYIFKNCNSSTKEQGLLLMYLNYMYLLFRALTNMKTVNDQAELAYTNAACAYLGIVSVSMSGLSFDLFVHRTGAGMQGDVLAYVVLKIVVQMRGILRVPSVYEYSKSPLEIIWFILNAYKDVEFLRMNPRRCNERFDDEKRRYFDLDTRSYWNNRLLDVMHSECYVSENDNSVNILLYTDSTYTKYFKFKQLPDKTDLILIKEGI